MSELGGPVFDLELLPWGAPTEQVLRVVGSLGAVVERKGKSWRCQDARVRPTHVAGTTAAPKDPAPRHLHQWARRLLLYCAMQEAARSGSVAVTTGAMQHAADEQARQRKAWETERAERKAAEAHRRAKARAPAPAPAPVVSPRAAHRFEHGEAGCVGCEVFGVLRQVEGFHETLDVSEHSRERVVQAVEAAALRAYRMGLEAAGATVERLRAVDREAEGFLA